MESKLGWIIVIVLVLNKISFTSSITVQAGTFQYLHRHPKLRSCADKILKENLYVGGRVHMLTGECEGLNRSWVFNQTVQRGYAYTKKVSVKESYTPPLEDAHIEWTLPGVLHEGAIVAVELEAPPGFYGFNIHFFDILDLRKFEQFDWDDFEMVRASLVRESSETMPDLIHFKFSEMKKSKTSHFDDVVCTQPQIMKEMKRKISFRAHTGSLELLVDDHEICMVNTTVDLTTLRKITISVSSGAFLHGVEFIDA